MSGPDVAGGAVVVAWIAMFVAFLAASPPM
jgi:hypothetical protein